MKRPLHERDWKVLQWLVQHAPAKVTDRSRPTAELFVTYGYVELSEDAARVTAVTPAGRRALRDRFAFAHFYRCPYCDNPTSFPDRGVLHRTELLAVEDDGFLLVGCRDCKASHSSCHPDLYGKLPTSKPALERDRLLSKGTK